MAISIPLPHYILKYTYLEGNVSSFLLRGLHYVLIYPINPKDNFNTPREIVFFHI
jgi:hypothetical protein